MEGLDKDLISIIVPVYNVEQYVKKCLDSLCSQSYTNIEIIVVNDGATDNSEKIILDNFSGNDKVKYYKKENGGLSSARNYGINMSRGKYLAFVDSDDWVQLDFIKELYQSICETGSEVAICNMEYTYTDGRVKKRTPKIDNKEILDSVEALRYLFVGEKYKFHAQNKMYLASLFKDNGIYYTEGKIYEDVFTTYKLLYKANKVALVNKDLYYYLQSRPGSILATRFNEKRFDIIEALNNIKAFLEENDLPLEKEFQKLYVINIISLVNYLYPIYRSLSSEERKHYKNRLISKGDRKCIHKYLTNEKLTKVEKIRFFLIKNCLYIYTILLSLLKMKG